MTGETTGPEIAPPPQEPAHAEQHPARAEQPGTASTPAGSSAPTVVAVVVTYNREDLLAQCLDALAAQTRPLDAVVVIDNASTDGSGAVADAHPIATDVMHLRRNVGGAGGFAAGIARALRHHHADWVWVMDDDTIAQPRALAALMHAVDTSPVPLSVLSSRAVWIDGRNHPMNTQRSRWNASRRETREALAAGGTPIRTASYVSALLNADDVRRLGLPLADYFIWSDDFEHTGRLLREGRGIRVPASVVEHRTAKFSSARSNPGARFYYDVRNRIWALTRSDAFTTTERALFGARSAQGWLRTVIRTRGDLLPLALKAGYDGFFRSPRPNPEVLAADGEAAADVRALEQGASQ